MVSQPGASESTSNIQTLSMAFDPALSRIPRQKTTSLTLIVLLLLPADLKVIAHDKSLLLLVDLLVQPSVLNDIKLLHGTCIFLSPSPTHMLPIDLPLHCDCVGAAIMNVIP